MATYFADTWFWVATSDERDNGHHRAVDLSNAIGLADRIVTSEMVMIELLAYFSGEGVHMREVAADLVDSLKNNSQVTIVAQSHRQFERAFKRYRQYSDKDWSLTDCASMLIMTERNIQTALTNDRHFVQAGFSIRND